MYSQAFRHRSLLSALLEHNSSDLVPGKSKKLSCSKSFEAKKQEKRVDTIGRRRMGEQRWIDDVSSAL